jgi:hypothetical protein
MICTRSSCRASHERCVATGRVRLRRHTGEQQFTFTMSPVDQWRGWSSRRGTISTMKSAIDYLLCLPWLSSRMRKDYLKNLKISA